jgi:hypothetical protein
MRLAFILVVLVVSALSFVDKTDASSVIIIKSFILDEPNDIEGEYDEKLIPLFIKSDFNAKQPSNDDPAMFIILGIYTDDNAVAPENTLLVNVVANGSCIDVNATHP